MPPQIPSSSTPREEPPVLATLRRFLPYLWPAGQTEAKVRIVLAALIVLASKGVQLSMGFLYGAAIDKMVPGMEEGVALAIGGLWLVARRLRLPPVPAATSGQGAGDVPLR